jgi:uncharacterized protein
LPGPVRDNPRGFVGVVSAQVLFPECSSLKDKRVFLRRMRDHLTRRHGATFAEVGFQDLWQRAQVVFALAASDEGVLARSLDSALGYLRSQEWELVSIVREVFEIDA